MLVFTICAMIISIHASENQIEEAIDVKVINSVNGEIIYLEQAYPPDTPMYKVFEDLRCVQEVDANTNALALEELSIGDGLPVVYYASPKKLRSFDKSSILFGLRSTPRNMQLWSSSGTFEEDEKFGRFDQCKRIRFRIDGRQAFFNQWPYGFICKDNVDTAMIFTAEDRKPILYVGFIQPQSLVGEGPVDTRFFGFGYDYHKEGYTFSISYDEDPGRIDDSMASFLASTDVYHNVPRPLSERYKSALKRGFNDGKLPVAVLGFGAASAALGGGLALGLAAASGPLAIPGTMPLVAVQSAAFGIGGGIMYSHPPTNPDAQEKEIHGLYTKNETEYPFPIVDGEVYVY